MQKQTSLHKNAEFQNFVKDVVKQVAVNNPANVEELLAQKFIGNEANTVQEELTKRAISE